MTLQQLVQSSSMVLKKTVRGRRLGYEQETCVYAVALGGY